MKEILHTFNLVQEIEFPMHKAGNALDWIIHKEELNCIQNLTKLEFLSDHCIIEWTMRKAPLISEKIEKQSKNLKNINTEQFKKDLKNKLGNMQKNVNIEEMYGNYIKTITSNIEEHAPTSRRKHIKKKHKSWFDEEALKLKVQRRRAEKSGKEENVNYTKGYICKLTNDTRNTYFKQKKKILRDKLNSGNNKTKLYIK